MTDTPAPRTSEWTPDELVLALEAQQLIARSSPRGKVTQELAAELRRPAEAVDATIRSLGASATLPPLAKVLVAHLGADAKTTARLAKAIRALWQER